MNDRPDPLVAIATSQGGNIQQPQKAALSFAPESLIQWLIILVVIALLVTLVKALF